MTVLLLLLQTTVVYLVVMCFEQFMTMYVCKKGGRKFTCRPMLPTLLFSFQNIFFFPIND